MGRPFTKMHGLGNDFVVIDATQLPFQAAPDVLQRLADRRLGVGCDQVLVLDPPDGPEADVHYRIFNADGSASAQCGNGARCVAKFLYDAGRLERPVARLQTGGRIHEVTRTDDGLWRADMGPPQLDPGDIPFDAVAVATSYSLTLSGGLPVEIAAVGMGNPHAVLSVADVASADVEGLGQALQAHPAFPEGVNVGFLQVIDATRARLRVCERGVGETPACGSGACAAAVAGRRWGKLSERVTMQLTGGDLAIEWDGGDGSVHMTGPAATVFEGTWTGEDA